MICATCNETVGVHVCEDNVNCGCTEATCIDESAYPVRDLTPGSLTAVEFWGVYEDGTRALLTIQPVEIDLSPGMNVTFADVVLTIGQDAMR